MVARGEVRWYEHPDAGRRPFLILTRSEAVPVLNQVLAVPATRAIRDIPTEVPLDEDDGMPGPCVLALDNVSLIPAGALHSTDHSSLGGEAAGRLRGAPRRHGVHSLMGPGRQPRATGSPRRDHSLHEPA